MSDGTCYCKVCGKEWNSFYDVQAHVWNKHDIKTAPDMSVGYREENNE